MNQYIDAAVNHYRSLLEEQLARVERMNCAAPAKDFTALPVVTIGVIDGDGIGPIISKQTTRVLEALLKDELAAGSIVLKDVPPNCTVVGNPGRVVRKQGIPMGVDLDQVNLPDPMLETIQSLTRRVEDLERQLRETNSQEE